MTVSLSQYQAFIGWFEAAFAKHNAFEPADVFISAKQA